MSAYLGLFKRDLSLAFRQKTELLQPLMFFVLVISLFPLGIGPEPATLQKIGPGVIWVAAILSALLGLERLFRDDFSDGTLEQLILADISLPIVVLIKVSVHWLVSIVPLLVLSPIWALFLHLSEPMYWALVATLLVGTPILSLIGAIAVGLTVGINKGGVLVALLLIPFFMPILIFATAAVESASMNLSYTGQIAIIGAMFLFSLALAPMAIAYALKVSQS